MSSISRWFAVMACVTMALPPALGQTIEDRPAAEANLTGAANATPAAAAPSPESATAGSASASQPVSVPMAEEVPPNASAQSPAAITQETSSHAAAPTLSAQTGPTLDVIRGIAKASLRGSRSEARDRATLAAFYQSREGKPLWVSTQGLTERAKSVLAEFERADEWGLDPAAYTVNAKQRAAGSGDPDQLATDEIEISWSVLRYARHASGGRVDPQQLTKYLDRQPQRPADAAVLAEIDAADDPARYLRDLHPKHPQFEALRKAYNESRQNAERAAVSRRLLANLEQWRWMPHDLGRFHVQVNVPEFMMRVVSDGRAIHSERVIVGKVDTQTPIFSDEMEQVIFHPFWGVPNSIKQNEVLPSLRGNGAVLAKHNLRIQIGGRDVDPRSVDWSRYDIRNVHVYQPPGRDNVLGVVKFRFPNKHDVYMHDTPTKSLFQQSVRMYSHGCMRVQNPVRLAELILAEDRQMPPERVRALTLPGAPENNQINLSRRVPVHITYFTARVEDDGSLKTFKDIYGHEERIGLGLEGKFAQIKPVPEPKGPARAEPVASLSEQWFGGFGFGGGGGGGGSRGDWAQRVFSGGN